MGSGDGARPPGAGESEQRLRAAAGRVFVALDLPDLEDAVRCAAALAPLGCRFKVGLELFCRHGPRAVEAVQRVGGPVLIDLKLHDIPRTAERAVRALAALGAWGVTLHATGGPVMLRQAVEAAAAGAGGAGAAASGAAGGRLRCLAVTVLTSLDEALLHALGVRTPLREQVESLARLALAAGCDGVVASPSEAALVRAATAPGFLVVTPGVRPPGDPAGDQARFDTPAAAVNAGADFLVVGRPVVGAADPAGALRRIAEEIAAADAG